MTQPVFGATSFSTSGGPNPKDAFDLVTGEVLQVARERFPERSFLVDENVQAVADRVHSCGATEAARGFLSAPYTGKWIIVAFRLGDHLSRFGMEIVNAQTPAQAEGEQAGRVPTPTRYGLTCIFDTEPFGEKLAGMTVGDPLTVMGQIEQLNAHSIRLRHCEVVG